MKKTTNLIAGISLAVVVLAGGGIWWFYGKTPPAPPLEKAYNQEFTELGQNIVQYYLRLPKQSFIVGRQNKSYTKINEAARKTLLSIKEPQAKPVALNQKEIEAIESKGIALTGWLSQPQKLSTRLVGNQKTNNDKYNNQVLQIDRFMILLGGKDMGLIYTRDPKSGSWTGWKTEGTGLNSVIDLVRKGGI